MRGTWIVAWLVGAVLLGTAVPARAAAPVVACSGDPTTVTRLDMTVGGEPTYGLYVVPEQRPRGLVVVQHGYAHTVKSWRRHLVRMAKRNAVIAVAMNYRGTIETPEGVRGWQVKEGAEESNAVARLFDDQCPGLPTIDLYSVSMGSNAAGLALAAQPKRKDGRPLWDYWFTVEGAANVIETYLGARILAPFNDFARRGAADIERQMGGPIEQRHETYRERTVVNRVPEIAKSGLRGVVLVHGLGDGLVPYNQSAQLSARLAEHGIPIDLFSVGTRGSGESGTTIDGYVTNNVDPSISPFAGHASESSETHVVGLTGFERLAAFFARGEAPCNRTFVVDGNTGTTTPDPASGPPPCRFDFPGGGGDSGGGGGGGGGSGASGGSGGEAERERVAIALPGAASCQGRRRLTLRLRPPRGQRIVQATVYVNGKRVRRRRGRSIRTIALRNLTRRPLRIRVVSITSKRRLIVTKRSYGGCRHR